KILTSFSIFSLTLSSLLQIATPSRHRHCRFTLSWQRRNPEGLSKTRFECHLRLSKHNEYDGFAPRPSWIGCAWVDPKSWSVEEQLGLNELRQER
ncbi:hypothetical protein Tsubulata_013701, partial [Turnera subulata]